MLCCVHPCVPEIRLSARRLRAAGRLALVVVLPALGAPAALAVEWYEGVAPAKRDEWIVTDGSTSVTSHGSVFVSTGVTAALNGKLQQSGARVRIEAMAGSYGYTNDAGTHVNGRQVEGGALIGYEWIWREARLAGLVGLSVRNTTLSITDPGNPVVGTSVGVKGSLDFYTRPTDNTMVSAHGSFSSNDMAYYTRFKAGYRIGSNLFVGPEAYVMGNDFYSQWRLGVHLTGMQMGPVQAGISAGYLHDREQKGGAYGTFDLRAQF